MPESSGSGVLDQSPPIGLQAESPTPCSDEFDSLVEEIRRRYGSDTGVLTGFEDRIRRRLGVAPRSVAAAVLGGLVGVGIRLALVLLATAVVGEWVGIPWGRWAVILGFFAAFDGARPIIGPPIDVPSGPRVKRIIEDWTPLLPTMARESDLRDLADFLRRMYRPVVNLSVGVSVAAIVLTAGWLFAPDALSELPIGSTVLLALLLFDFGAATIFGAVLVYWVFMAREARYDHHLFWPSPTDSPEVKEAMRLTTSRGSIAGFWITVFLVLTVVLVSWDSPLVVPLGGGFILIGYLAAFGAALRHRASVLKIVQRVREQRLRGLRDRIDGFGPEYTDLSPKQSQRVRDLLFLHNMIRDAPTTSTTTRTVMNTAVGLIIPTILFLTTVFGEVYTERFFDAILP